MAPASSAAKATTGLNVDPGGYTPAMTLSVSGLRGSVDNSCHKAGVRPVENCVGSKLGLDTMASTSPVNPSSTTQERLCSTEHRLTTNSCKAASRPTTAS